MKKSSSKRSSSVGGSSSRSLVLAAAVALAAGCATGTKPSPATSSNGTDKPAAVVTSDAMAQSLLSSACYDCHSNRESAPWYGTLAPSYWFSAKALKTLNFSAWQSYDARQRKDELTAIVKTVESGEMPPRDYALFVSSARLTTEQRNVIAAWAKGGGE